MCASKIPKSSCPLVTETTVLHELTQAFNLNLTQLEIFFELSGLSGLLSNHKTLLSLLEAEINFFGLGMTTPSNSSTEKQDSSIGSTQKTEASKSQWTEELLWSLPLYRHIRPITDRSYTMIQERKSSLGMRSRRTRLRALNSTP